MKKLFITLGVTSALIFSLSCSRAASKPHFGGSTGAKNDGTGDSTSQTGDTEGTDNKGLQLIASPGSKLRFLNGRALTKLYGRVFKPDDQGYAHCADKKPNDFDGCNWMFAAEERPSMGFFDLYSQRMNRGVQNVANPENLTLNYTRNLRAALGRECLRLVTAEEKALAANNMAPTIIVKTGGPTAESLEAFFRKLLGIEANPEIAVDVPFAAYVTAFKTAVAMDTDKDKAQHNAFINVCISVAMDPQVFLY